MCTRSFFCEEAIIKQRTSSKKELCEIDEEAIWDSRFASFLFFILLLVTRKFGRSIFEHSLIFIFGTSAILKFVFEILESLRI